MSLNGMKPKPKKRGPAKGHGGRPKGSGLPPQMRRNQLSARVSPETLTALCSAAAARGISVGRLIDSIAKQKTHGN